MFQFYLSSIKSLRGTLNLLKILMFQFYLSSIKRCGRRKKLLRNTGFNSTLVQLKAG